MRRLGLLAARLVLLLAAVGVALVLADRLLKAAGYEKRVLRIEGGERGDLRGFHVFEDRHFVFDPDMIWRPREGVAPFNDQGYRGPELPAEKPPGAFWIFAVGDSNTLGWEGEGGANWPGSLHRRLQAEDEGIAVVNAGVYGYTSHQGLARLRRCLAFSPDVVLISFGANDAHRVAVADRQYTAGSAAARGLIGVVRNFRVGCLLLNSWDRLRPAAPNSTARVPLPEYRRNLTEMVRIARLAGAAPVLLTRPSVGEIDDPEWWKNWAGRYNVVTAEVAETERTPLVDLFSEFKELDEELADESHFTAAGHDRAAAVLHQALRPLLPTRRSGSSAGAVR